MKTDRIKVKGSQGPQRRTPAARREKTSHVARGGSDRGSHAGTHGPNFEEHLRSRGIRVTAQRLAVYRALAEDGTHPTADVVLARVRSHTPMAPSTVYRTLESFEAEKLIRRVSTTGDIVRFDANIAPHQHLVCRVCGRMMDHFGPALAAAPIPTETISGFIVEELDIRLVGRCEACRAAASKADSHRVSKSRRRP